MNGINVVFMGSEDFSLPIVRALAADAAGGRLALVGVVTQPDRPAGRGQRIGPNPVKSFATEHAIPVLQPDRLRDAGSIESVLDLKPGLIVVASYGQILPSALLDAPRHRTLNLHPSVLPRYRGASPITAPILNGDVETGATLMLMRPSLDAGPILAQVGTTIGAEESAGELESRLAELSAELLTRCLPFWIKGAIEPVEQDETAATFTARLQKSMGEIDWTLSAEDIARRVRAFNPWPTAYTSWNGRMLKILRAHVSPGSAAPGVVCVDGREPFTVGTGHALLSVELLQLAGGRPLPGGEVMRGHAALRTAVLGTSSQ